MTDNAVYILGIGSTPVGRFPDRGFSDLVREAVCAALADAGDLDANTVTHLSFSNYMMGSWGQRAQRGQHVLAPLVADGTLPAGLPVVNIENACASGSAAFNGAWKHCLSDQPGLALAVGVEKMNRTDLDPAEAKQWFADGIATGIDALDPDEFFRPYHELSEELGVAFENSEDRSVAMDIYALWAKDHMKRYGTTVGQIAMVAAKNHTHAVDNPRAQYRFPLSNDDVLQDRSISEPLTRAMCAPGGDGAAAMVLCSGEFLATQPDNVRRRAVRVAGHSLAGANPDAGWEGDRAPVNAARTAYAMAGMTPDDVDLVELHDACAFAEIHLSEDLGFCERGQGGALVESGETWRGGRLPISPSGGLLSRGHPIGATGLLMLNEVTMQLRGEAGPIQVEGANVGLAENGGGFTGHDVSLCSVTLLSRT